ncbi:MAG: amidohydrolase [Woeseiaceae bacterium]
MRRLLTTAVTPTLFFLCLSGCSNDTDEYADNVFVNANVYTVDNANRWAEAVAVRGDVIVAVGSQPDIDKWVGPDTVQYDVGGKLLLPGFIDAHMHPISGGAYATSLSLNTFGTVTEWVSAIGEYADAHPDKPLVFGYGFLASTFGPTGPTRQLIDAVVDDRPVLIMDEGIHGAWANSMALEMLNISRDTKDPVPGFSYYKRDANGDATGYLLEDTASMARDDLNAITEQIVVDGTKLTFEVMNQYGVTSAFDAGALGYEDMVHSVLKQLSASGDMTVRVIGSSRPSGPEDLPTAIETALHWRDTVKGENYHYRMLKLMHDGTVEGRTAAMFEDYQGEPGNSGHTVFTQQELSSTVSAAAAEDLDVHIHGLGERAVHEALNAIEASRNAYPNSETRYAICHIQVILDQDVPRFAELDVFAQSTPLWAAYDIYGKQFVSDDQFDRFWRFKSLADLGVKLTFGSDFPASGAGALGMSPMFNIEIGHTRQEPGSPDSLIQPRESERLDIETLIAGYTINAAYQLHMEDEIGSIEVGKKADLIVLSENVFEADDYEIAKIDVELTMQDGNIVFQAAE